MPLMPLNSNKCHYCHLLPVLNFSYATVYQKQQLPQYTQICLMKYIISFIYRIELKCLKFFYNLNQTTLTILLICWLVLLQSVIISIICASKWRICIKIIGIFCKLWTDVHEQRLSQKSVLRISTAIKNCYCWMQKVAIISDSSFSS